MKSIRFNIPLLALTVLAIFALVWGGFRLVAIDTDITRFLPRKDPVLSDAAYIFKYNPIQGEVAVDLGVSRADPDRLVQAGRMVTQRMETSGLFTRVGTESIQSLVPGLMTHIADNLPVLFTEAELKDQVLPLLTGEKIRDRMAALPRELLDFTAIGQSGFIARDPLSIRNIILAKLAQLAPSDNIRLYKGNLLSADQMHLLIVAAPALSGTDTVFARKLDALMQTIAGELGQAFGSPNPVTLSPVGAYRNAFDNERIVRRDVTRALVFSTLGIALLLIFSFPRPVIGLFAFLPAIAGTAAAFFVLALFHKSVSIMALGFGGAIISITVDHGIAYLLFLDRSRASFGREASREIWAIGLMAALTTVGAFSALCLTGFPMFVQLGQFAALGIAFSYLFVHLVFPRIFSELPAAGFRRLPFRRLVDRIPVSRKPAALTALAVGVGMLFFAMPRFNVSLSAMNTVTGPTAAAEELVTRVWGSSLFSRVFMMTEGASVHDLQEKGDWLLDGITADTAAGRLASGFIPAMIYPGEDGCRRNFSDWKRFWTPERVEATRAALDTASSGNFAPDAFAPFLKMISADAAPVDFIPIPAALYPLLEILQKPDGGWIQFATLTPGPGYDPDEFHATYGAEARIFDSAYFSERLGHLLFSSFIKMSLIVGGCVALLLFFFFLDLPLTAITLSPVVFAMVGTLATLRLTGRALDIPALMLSIVVLGMGIDYGIYLTRAHQRYGTADHPEYGRVRLAVVLAAVSTLIGFGVLCFSDHALLRSAGLTCFLGISYSLIGGFVILPPLLTYYLSDSSGKPAADAPLRKRLLFRYRRLEAYPRLFARFKTGTDPMFSELPRFLDGGMKMRIALDIGCGYGVPGCWLLEHFRELSIYGIDPDPERVRVAGRVFGERGEVACAAAPEIPAATGKADAAFLLDIIHFLDDPALALTLGRLREEMLPEAMLIIRAVVPPEKGKPTLRWKIDALRMRLSGIKAHHRPVSAIEEMLQVAGFTPEKTMLSGGNQELVWLIAKK